MLILLMILFLICLQPHSCHELQVADKRQFQVTKKKPSRITRASRSPTLGPKKRKRKVIKGGRRPVGDPALEEGGCGSLSHLSEHNKRNNKGELRIETKGTEGPF